jgi:uncharacterized protein YneF (UPF0154 family)
MLVVVAFFIGLVVGLIGSYFIFRNNKDKVNKYNDYLKK